MIKKSIIILLMLFSIFTILGAVSAADTNSTSTLNGATDPADIKVDNWVENVTTYTWAKDAQYNYNDISYYLVKATNNGPDTVSVQVKNTIPQGLTIIEWYVRFPGGSWIHNDPSFDPSTGIWNVGTLAKGNFAYLNYDTKVTGSNANFNTTAAVINNGQYVDPNPNNDLSWAMTNVSASSHVAITQTANPTTINNGDSTTFTVTATNQGPDTVTNLKITNTLNRLTYQSYSTLTGTYDSATGVWTIPTLANGATATLTLTTKATTPLTTTVTGSNTATTTSQDQNEPTGQTHATTTTPVTINPAAHVAITNTASSTTPNYYTPVTFTITAKNNGPDSISGLQITDLLPAGLTYMSSSPAAGTTYTSGTGIWNIGTLTSGQQVTLTITANVTATGALANTAFTSAQNQNEPTGQTHESKTVNLNVPAAADIQTTQTASTTTPTWNKNVVLTITVKNNGPDTAHNVQITSLLPLDLLYQSQIISKGTYDYMSGIWNVGTLTSGQSSTLALTCKVMGAGSIVNWANKTGETEYDWKPSNDNSSVTLTVATPGGDGADVVVTQTASKTSLNIGDPVTITITARNSGPKEAKKVYVTDLLPPGLTYLSHTASTGTYNPSTGVWDIGNIKKDKTYTLTITAIATRAGTITNLARKTAQDTYDPVLTNDLQSISYTISNRVTNFTNQATPTGTVNLDDGTSNIITLPFTVTFYGKTYNTIYINVNGLVSFGTPITGSPPYYTSLPSNIPYAAPFWADISLTNAGSVYYDADSDKVTITWDKVPGYTKTTLYNTFQVIIRKDGYFAFIYGDMQWKNDNDNTVTYPSYSMINSGTGSNPTKKFWDGTQDLNLITDIAIWFDSNGNTINAQVDPDIAVTQTASNYNPKKGDYVTITVTVVNNGPENATGVQITDQIPAGLTLVSAITNKGTYNTQTGVWDIGNMSVNETVTLIFTVKATKKGTFTNQALKTAENEYDPVSENNISQITLKLK